MVYKKVVVSRYKEICQQLILQLLLVYKQLMIDQQYMKYFLIISIKKYLFINITAFSITTEQTPFSDEGH